MFKLKVLKENNCRKYDLSTNLQKSEKNKVAKVYLVKPMVFPVIMYGCESWTIKKAEQ